MSIPQKNVYREIICSRCGHQWTIPQSQEKDIYCIVCTCKYEIQLDDDKENWSKDPYTKGNLG